MNRTPVSALKAGDNVRVSGGQVARVICVVESANPPRDPLFSLPGGLEITANHPIRVAGGWKKPSTVGNPVTLGGKVYNFVLDSNHIILVDGIECVTLCHAFTDEGVAHEYLGTERVVKDLMDLHGWTDGKVVVDLCIHDEDGSGAVIGLHGATGADKPRQELCSICFAAKADCAVVPCGHQCGCESCLNQVRNISLVWFVCFGFVLDEQLQLHFV